MDPYVKAKLKHIINKLSGDDFYQKFHSHGPDQIQICDDIHNEFIQLGEITLYSFIDIYYTIKNILIFIIKKIYDYSKSTVLYVNSQDS